MLGRTLDTGFPGERAFEGAGHKIRFVVRECGGSRHLVAVFSSFHLSGRPPPYRYVRTLSNFDMHRMFVLDDQGPRDTYPRPCWYLGRASKFTFAEGVRELIDGVASDLGVDRSAVVTAGSSMGGYAAVYFAVTAGYGCAISGEPQTLLGDYLSSPTEGKRAILEYITGDTGRKAAIWLNQLLPAAIRSSPHRPFIYVHCARHGTYLEREIVPLLAACDEANIPYELDRGDYADHADLSEHFPRYLVATLSRIRDVDPAIQPIVD